MSMSKDEEQIQAQIAVKNCLKHRKLSRETALDAVQQIPSQVIIYMQVTVEICLVTFFSFLFVFRFGKLPHTDTKPSRNAKPNKI